MIETIFSQLMPLFVIFISGAVFWLWEIQSPLHQIAYKAKFFKELGSTGITIVFKIIYAYVFVTILKLLTFLSIGESAVFVGVIYVPLWLRFITAFVLADFSYYLFHRMMHTNPLLWATHKWHHSVKQVWWLSGKRTSLTSGFVIYFIKLIWYPLLDIPPELMVVVAIQRGFYENWIHLNVKWSSWMGILEWIFVTPRVHVLHHISTEGKNLSGTFTFFDRLFGTYMSPDDFDLKKYENKLDDEPVTIKTILGI